MDDDLEQILDDSMSVPCFSREPWGGWIESALTQCRDAGRTIGATQLLQYLELKGKAEGLPLPAKRTALSSHLTATGGALWAAVKNNRG